VDWWQVLAVAIGGVAVGYVASFHVGYFRELGRERAARRIRRRDERREREAAEAAAAQVAAEREAEAQREREFIEQLRRDRVGAKVLHRVTADDVGIRMTVVGLAPREPLTRVTMEFEPMPGRIPTPYDPPIDAPVNYKWSSLTALEADQRHRTARVIAHSHDDRDGWVEFERLDP
jgi:hypothetical protein